MGLALAPVCRIPDTNRVIRTNPEMASQPKSAHV
jgi:hypothetical protein